MISLKLNPTEKRLSAARRMVRLMLRHDEVLRLPPAGQELQVISGVAWITVNGRDIFLVSGERFRLPSRGDTTLISALGRQSMILEVFGAPWGA